MNNKIITKGAWQIQCPTDWSWDSDNNQWEGYHFWYVYGGEVTITTEKNTYHLQSNDVFLFDLKQNYLCRHNSQNPLSVYAIYFQAMQIEGCHICRNHIKNHLLLGNMMEHTVKLFAQNEERDVEIWMEAILSEFMKKEREEEKVHPVVDRLNQMLKEKVNTMLSLAQMCDCTGYSKNHLIRIVQKEVGDTPIHYQMKYKIEHAKSLLTYSNELIVDIATQVGFNDANYFSKVFKQWVGVSPSEYKKNFSPPVTYK